VLKYVPVRSAGRRGVEVESKADEVAETVVKVGGGETQAVGGEELVDSGIVGLAALGAKRGIAGEARMLAKDCSRRSLKPDVEKRAACRPKALLPRQFHASPERSQTYDAESTNSSAATACVSPPPTLTTVSATSSALLSTSTHAGLPDRHARTSTPILLAPAASISPANFASPWLSVNGNYSHDDSRVLKSPNAFDPSSSGNHLLRRPVNSGSLILNTSYRAGI